MTTRRPGRSVRKLLSRGIEHFVVAGQTCVHWNRQHRWALAAAVAVIALVTGTVNISASLGRGLVGRYFESGDWTGDPFLVVRDRRPTRERFVYDFTDKDGRTSVEWVGFIRVRNAGDYQLSIQSNGVAGVWIDRLLAASHEIDPSRGPTGVVRLTPGFHHIRIRYADHRDGGAFRFNWAIPGGPLLPLSHLDLFPTNPDVSTLGRLKITLADAAASVTALATFLLALLVGCLVVRKGWPQSRIRGSHWPLDGRRALAEAGSHIILLGAVAVTYVLATWNSSAFFWGFATLGRWTEARSPAFVTELIALVIGTFLVIARFDGLQNSERRTRSRLLWAALAGLAAFFVFWWWRTSFVNSDGASYRWMIPAVVSGEYGYAFDEMWETYLHAQFWQITHSVLGWSVRSSYQVVSCLAGAAMVVTTWLYGRLMVRSHALLFAALFLGGGYLQLFFGDVEHYSLVSVALVVYLATSLAYLREACPVWVPAFALGIAMTFHMEAGFVAPSLVALGAVALMRRQYAALGVAAVAFVGPIVATMMVLEMPLSAVYRDSWGTQALRRLIGSALSDDSFGEGSQVVGHNWAFFRFDRYHWNQYNLLAVLFPAHLALLPLAAWRRVRLDAINVHLLAAAAGMAFFHFNYRAMLGVEHDWNLFANAALPLAALTWRNLLLAEDLPFRTVIAAGWFVVSWLSTTGWLIGNHTFMP
jgi:hypothetical protein